MNNAAVVGVFQTPEHGTEEGDDLVVAKGALAVQQAGEGLTLD